ncbi:hypothetical protein [Propionibacterium acidifaciens]|uniref:hypothetical protein n=1 Tax=Propionibacterium acidifaciens TaxID=556499 RepID=UPI0023F1B1C4|nr:hypothetical protein [Propionibacterium acidifaciens]
MIRLDWVPKPFRDGDIAGEGTKKLLGTSLAAPNLLLRETAQNSWDAHIGHGVIPEYQMRFVTLDAPRMSVLRGLVFPETFPGSELAKVVRRSRVSAIEVHDRGTTGLDGPTRNDVHVGKGEPTNFRDFILTVGAPRDQEYGGGTYGFGKTAAFRASRCGAIVVWTRIRDGEGFEERFIAISIIPNFSMGEKRYTGQQWWGRAQQLEDGMNVQPIEGDDAHELGEKLFERGFGERETGTSIMILDPAFDDGGREGFVRMTADAVARNLWPKMIPGQPVDRQMGISLINNGSPVDLATGWSDRITTSRESCLAAIRKVQSGQEAEEDFVEALEIWCKRPKQLLGHLAISPCPSGLDEEFVNSVTLMREPELVVCEKEYPDLQNGRDSWVAVFKPIRELDNAFAEAEPPTHDDWKPDSLEGRKGTFVRVALRRIKEELKDYLNPTDDDVQSGERVSTGRLAASLDVLAVGADGGLANGMSSGKRSRSRGVRSRASVEVLSQELLPMPDALDGRALTRLELRASTGANLMTVTPDLAVVVEGSGAIKDTEQVRVDSWTTAEGEVTAAERLQVHGGDVFYVDISYPENAAVNCTFRSEVTK